MYILLMFFFVRKQNFRIIGKVANSWLDILDYKESNFKKKKTKGKKVRDKSNLVVSKKEESKYKEIFCNNNTCRQIGDNIKKGSF